MRLLRAALGNPAIARLEAVSAAASAGGWTFSVLLSVYAYYEDGAVAVGLAVTARMLPAALLAPLTPRLAVSGRRALAASALARLAILESVALAVSVDAPLAVVLALAAAFELAAAMHPPARSALLGELARTPGELAAAHVTRTLDDSGLLAGALAAGLLTSIAGLNPAFAITGVAFAVAAAVLARVPAARVAPAAHAPARAVSPLALAGALGHPGARLRLALFGASALVDAMVELVLVVAALDVLHMGDGGVGWLRAAAAAGALVAGPVALARLRSGRLAPALAAGWLLAGVPLALVGAWPHPGLAAALLVVAGAGYALEREALSALNRRLVPADLLAWAPHAERLVRPLARASGAMLAALIVAIAGDRTAIAVVGLTLPAIALVATRTVARAERRTLRPDPSVAVLRHTAALASLPDSTLETLALHAIPEEVAPGETIVDDGHVRIVESGTLELRRDGGAAGRVRAGSILGETALIARERPHESARAITRARVLTLDAGRFLSAIGAPCDARPRARSRVEPHELPVPAAVTSRVRRSP